MVIEPLIHCNLGQLVVNRNLQYFQELKLKTQLKIVETC